MRDITVKQFLEAKMGLEKNLLAAIQKEVDEFEAATGTTPETIYVNMHHHGYIGGLGSFVVGSVTARTLPF
jgi:hypothetical protein